MSRHDTIDEIEDKYMDRIKELTAERDCWIDTANMFKDAITLATDQISKGDYTPARSTLLTAIATEHGEK